MTCFYQLHKCTHEHVRLPRSSAKSDTPHRRIPSETIMMNVQPGLSAFDILLIKATYFLTYYLLTRDFTECRPIAHLDR